jgi:polyisoprenyl-phosphate glycosyltransferase
VIQRLDGPVEAIFVDDGGSDCSSIILRAKAKDEPRFDAPDAS